MNPTDIYYKTKRTFLFFSGALLLAIFAGFKIAVADRITILPFRLERPELLATILFIAVLFYLFQLSLQWGAQSAEVQRNRFHKIDFVASVSIGIVSVLSYGGWIASPFVTTLKLEDVSSLASTITAGVAAVVAIFASKLFERISATVGRWIKGREAAEDEKVISLLTSNAWMLHYNPQNIGARKKITFNENGSIGSGKNSNESTWRVRNGLVEILNAEGRIHSRFAFDPKTFKFLHTNDEDTPSIRSQYIFRAPKNSQSP